MNAGPSGTRAINNRMRRGSPIPAAMLQKLIDNGKALAGKQAQRPSPVTGIRPAPQFEVSVFKDGETYYATVKPGYFLTRDSMFTGDPSLTYWIPTLDGTPIDETVGDPAMPPKVAVANGQYLYLHFFTDSHGFVEDNPTIEVDDGSAAITTHHQPGEVDPIDGEYWFRIARVDISDEGVVTIRPYVQGGPMEFVANLWSYKQIGGGAKVIKDRDNEADEYRFRTLKARTSSPQITVTENENDITIEGNGHNSSITGFATLLESIDGLLTGVSELPIGSDFNLEIGHVPTNIDFVNQVVNKSSAVTDAIIYVRGGIAYLADPGTGAPVIQHFYDLVS